MSSFAEQVTSVEILLTDLGLESAILRTHSSSRRSSSTAAAVAAAASRGVFRYALQGVNEHAL